MASRPARRRLSDSQVWPRPGPLMPVVRALAIGDTEISAAYTTTAVSTDTATMSDRGSDKLSLLVVGAFLLGLGSVLRRVA